MSTYINPNAIGDETIKRHHIDLNDIKGTSESVGVVQLSSSVNDKSATKAASAAVANTIYEIAKNAKSDIDILNVNSALWGSYYDCNNLDDFVESGIYKINGIREGNDNIPILNTGGKMEFILSVMTTEDCVSQTLTLLNGGGGDTNIYIRTRQNGAWKPWGKLQTNVEVGAINQTQMDGLIDNGIYSGILSSTGETFVIICINNYAIAQQVGVHHISHMKYSLVVGTGKVKIEKRTRDAYGFWTDWEDVSNGNSTPEIVYEKGGSSFTVNIDPNKYYKINNVSNLTVNFNNGQNGVLNNYMFEVTFSGGNTLTLPSGMKLANGNIPDFKNGYTYQISVINNLVVFTEFN